MNKVSKWFFSDWFGFVHGIVCVCLVLIAHSVAPFLSGVCLGVGLFNLCLSLPSIIKKAPR